MCFPRGFVRVLDQFEQHAPRRGRVDEGDETPARPDPRLFVDQPRALCFEARERGAVARWRILELLRERLLARALEREGAHELLDSLAAEVAEKRRDPYSAVEEILGGGDKEQV